MSAPIQFLKLRQATQALQAGGVIAYPTEGVFGLGCDPANASAVQRILELKQRHWSAGLILIAANREQLNPWISPTEDEEQALSGHSTFTTWVVTAHDDCPDWITGGRPTCAIRITRHPIAAALCTAAESPLVSTSANYHGHAPAVSVLGAQRLFGAAIDYIVPGETGMASGASEIRIASTGAVLRASQQ
ncbi:MAG: Sua5/YciO/YrdC/YwlC family protein [Gammaproteobacteria bacterium]|nr:Sua5/YciO/YrdC/YwlC family protein [Gammaproteobacteria bacterium]